MVHTEQDVQINQNSISIKNYFKELRDVQLFDKEEQNTLASLAQKGDTKAFDKLVKSNLRFVVSVARQYTKYGYDLEDLISEGNVGLIKAIYRFDTSKGFKFISYAVWWIKQCMLSYIYDNGNMIRLPVSKINAITKLNKASDNLSKQLDREPTTDELASISDMTMEDVAIVYLDNQKQSSLDRKISHESDLELVDTIPGETLEDVEISINSNALHMEIKNVLSSLPARERKILSLFFGLNGHETHSLKEISETVGMTNERVRQLKEHSLRKLRTFSKSKRLKEFLDCKITEQH